VPWVEKGGCRWWAEDCLQNGQTNKQEHALILVVSTAGQLDSYPPPDTALYSYSYSHKYQEK
jgi:hypothetical protein